MSDNKHNKLGPFSGAAVWSNSKSGLFERCPRKYWYRYLAAHRGWEEPKGSLRYRAYQMRYLIESVPLKMGEMLHYRFRQFFTIVSNRERYRRETITEVTAGFLVDWLRQSQKLTLKDLGGCMKKTQLLDHALGDKTTARELEQWRHQMAALMDAFLDHPEVQWLAKNYQKIIPEVLDSHGFEVDEWLGVPAIVKPDCVVNNGDNYVIYDWKLGYCLSPDRWQGMLYETWLRKKYSIPDDMPVQVKFVYLADGKVDEFTTPPEERELIISVIQDDTQLWTKLLQEANPQIPPQDRFRLRPGEQCFSCAFQMVCPGLALAGREDCHE